MDPDDLLVQAPLRVFPGLEGNPSLLYKPWTRSELRSIAKDFPEITENPHKFQKEFKLVCKTYQPSEADLLQLCCLICTPAQLDKWVKEAGWDKKCEMEDGRPAARYAEQCHRLCGKRSEAIPQAFPKKTNWSLIRACKQKEEESIRDYRVILPLVFNQRPGINEPHDNASGALAACFVDG